VTGAQGPVGPVGTGGGATGPLFFIETATGPTATVQDGPFTVNQGDTVRIHSETLAVSGSTGSIRIGVEARVFRYIPASYASTNPESIRGAHATIRSLILGGTDLVYSVSGATEFYDVNISSGDDLFHMTICGKRAAPNSVFRFNFPSSVGLNTSSLTDSNLPQVTVGRAGDGVNPVIPSTITGPPVLFRFNAVTSNRTDILFDGSFPDFWFYVVFSF
jgi:hypothetical protein